MGNAMAVAAITIVVIMVATWLLSLAIKNASIVDIVWGLGFAVTSWVLALTIEGESAAEHPALPEQPLSEVHAAEAHGLVVAVEELSPDAVHERVVWQSSAQQCSICIGQWRHMGCAASDRDERGETSQRRPNR